jgi:hypothetical protein
MKRWLWEIYDRLGDRFAGLLVDMAGSSMPHTHPRLFKFLFYACFRIACIMSPESYNDYRDQIDEYYQQIKKMNTKLDKYLKDSK